MLHISPSLSLAKFIWSKPLQTSPAPMTLSANNDDTVEPMRLEASYNHMVNSLGASQYVAEGRNSAEEENSTPKMTGLREFWNQHMKVTEEKWKKYFEQKSSNQQQHDVYIETGEVDWGAVRERIAWRWLLSQEKPDNMNGEEWRQLQEMSVKLRPWFIYKNCALYSRMFYDPECRPIFQEFDFS